jgi:hypothetical protein
MRPALLLFLTLVGVLATSCGGGDDRPSASDWTTTFCTSTREWGEEVEQSVDEVRDLSSLTEELETAIESVREATDAYVAELRDLGAPDVDAPDDVDAALEGFADELDAETAEIDDAFDDASGLGGPATVGREVASSVAAMFTSLERTLESFGEDGVDEDLQQAFDDVEACDDLSR